MKTEEIWKALRLTTLSNPETKAKLEKIVRREFDTCKCVSREFDMLTIAYQFEFECLDEMIDDWDNILIKYFLNGNS